VLRLIHQQQLVRRIGATLLTGFALLRNRGLDGRAILYIEGKQVVVYQVFDEIWTYLLEHVDLHFVSQHQRVWQIELGMAVRKRRRAIEKVVWKLPYCSFPERRPSDSTIIHPKEILAETRRTQNRRSRLQLQFANEPGHMHYVNQRGILSLFFHLNSCCIPWSKSVHPSQNSCINPFPPKVLDINTSLPTGSATVK